MHHVYLSFIPKKHLFLLCTLCSTSMMMAMPSTAESLLEVYQEARTGDAEFAAAQAAYKAGKENKAIARAGLLPQVQASAVWQDTKTSPKNSTSSSATAEFFDRVDSTYTTYSVSLAQPLFDMSAWFSYQQGKASASIAESQFTSAQQQLIIRVAQTYFDVLKAQDNVTTANAEHKSLQQQLKQIKQRFQVGITNVTEVHEAQAVFDSSTAEQLLAIGQLRISKHKLTVITGKQYAYLAPLKPEFSATPPEPNNSLEWEKLAQQYNTQLKAAEFSMIAAKHNSKSKRAEHLPTVSGSISYSESDGSTYSDNETESESINITLTLPIFTGGRTTSNRKQAYFQYAEAKELYKKTERESIQTTQTHYLNVVTGVAATKARKQAITSNQSALKGTQAGYDAGTRDLVDVLNAQRNLFRAQRDYYQTVYTYIIDTLKLKAAAGVLAEPDVERINQWLNLDQI